MSDKNIAPVVVLSHSNDKHDKATTEVHPVLLQAFENILEYLGRDNDLTASEKANYEDTAVRAAKAFTSLTMTRTEIVNELYEILKTGFPQEPRSAKVSAGLVTQGPIQVFSYCPHHLLPVEYSAYVSYIPQDSGHVVGISKLARIAKLLGRRPILQEQLAADIADVLHIDKERSEKERSDLDNGGAMLSIERRAMPGMDSKGSAVLLIGKHSCMTCRGVESSALTTVAELRGEFWKSDMEQKFYQAIQSINTSTLV